MPTELTRSGGVICPPPPEWSTRPGAVRNLNCGGCFVWALKNKVCLWKVPQRRGNFEWCNMFLSTLSGKSKDPRPRTHAPAPPSRSTFRQFLFLSLKHNTHTISSVYDTEDCDTWTAAPKLIYWNVNSERPRRENNNDSLQLRLNLHV